MERDTQRRRVGFGTRAQSVFDFSIGVSLFVVVVIGVLVFVPTAFASLNQDQAVDEDDRLASERVADHLVESALASPDGPSRLSRICTVAYFDDEAACGFASGNSLAADSARVPSQPLNVTVEADVDGDGVRDMLCWDDDAATLNRVANCGDPADTAFTGGPSAVRNQQYVTATRLAELEGRDVFVVVRTW